MMYSERFERWFNMILSFEGIYGNDPSDSGGETYCGICRKLFPSLRVWKSLDKLPYKAKRAYKGSDVEMAEIKNIYYDKFWDKVKGDGYDDVDLAFQVADFAVNAGVLTSIKKLQYILGIKQDGIVGNVTLSHANSRKDITEKFKQIRRDYYKAISKKGNNIKFLKGWLLRVEKCNGRV